MTNFNELSNNKIKGIVKTELQLKLNKKDFKELTQALKLAFDNHLQWLSDLSYAMICQPEKLIEFCCCNKPYHHCNFGKWYYSVNNSDINSHIDFINLGKMHKALHLSVCTLIKEFSEHSKPSKTAYLEFKNIEELFLKEIKSFLHNNLEACVNTDHLTELPNRHALDIILKQEFYRIKRKQYQSSIAMLDIDFFKVINDKYGHSVGDIVLQKLSNLLASNIRNCDFVARYGGEEFIIYFPEIDCDKTFEIAEKLRRLIHQEPIEVSSNKFISLTCSFGIAAFNQSKSIKDSIADADRALYQAKESGRNKVVIYQP